MCMILLPIAQVKQQQFNDQVVHLGAITSILKVFGQFPDELAAGTP